MNPLSSTDLLVQRNNQRVRILGHKRRGASSTFFLGNDRSASLKDGDLKEAKQDKNTLLHSFRQDSTKSYFLHGNGDRLIASTFVDLVAFNLVPQGIWSRKVNCNLGWLHLSDRVYQESITCRHEFHLSLCNAFQSTTTIRNSPSKCSSSIANVLTSFGYSIHSGRMGGVAVISCSWNSVYHRGRYVYRCLMAFLIRRFVRSSKSHGSRRFECMWALSLKNGWKAPAFK